MFERILVATAIIVLAIPGLSQNAFAEAADDTAQRAVLVTGASSGIGRKIAETLAANGYFVYAGARKQADLDALNEIPNIQSVRLDVTRQDEIDAAVETVRGGGKGLYGLVNNAGIVTLGPMAELNADHEYSYSDEELIRMVKEATAKQRARRQQDAD